MIRRLASVSPQSTTRIPVSPFARIFFFDTRLAWFWLILRLVIGYEWFTAGWAKVTGVSIAFDSFGKPTAGGSWIAAGRTGVALTAFIHGALAKASGPFPAVQPWYATFLHYAVLPNTGVMAYVIAFGELLVGLGIIAGAFTGIAAFFGIFMNLNYILAGTISISPPLAIGALFLLLAWRVSGYYGVDRYLLPLLGTPWTRKPSPSLQSQAILATQTE